MISILVRITGALTNIHDGAQKCFSYIKSKLFCIWCIGAQWRSETIQLRKCWEKWAIFKATCLFSFSVMSQFWPCSLWNDLVLYHPTQNYFSLRCPLRLIKIGFQNWSELLVFFFVFFNNTWVWKGCFLNQNC